MDSIYSASPDTRHSDSVFDGGNTSLSHPANKTTADGKNTPAKKVREWNLTLPLSLIT
jgi:hypothetical protein